MEMTKGVGYRKNPKFHQELIRISGIRGGGWGLAQSKRGLPKVNGQVHRLEPGPKNHENMCAKLCGICKNMQKCKWFFQQQCGVKCETATYPLTVLLLKSNQ